MTTVIGTASTSAYADTEIIGADNEGEYDHMEGLAAGLYESEECDKQEGNNIRDCNIVIKNVKNGYTGNLTIPGVININIFWEDH